MDHTQKEDSPRNLIRRMVREEIDTYMVELFGTNGPRPTTERLDSGRKTAPDELNETAAAQYIGRSLTYLRNKRVGKSGPPYRTKGRQILYQRAALEAWDKEQRARP